MFTYVPNWPVAGSTDAMSLNSQAFAKKSVPPLSAVITTSPAPEPDEDSTTISVADCDLIVAATPASVTLMTDAPPH